MIRVTRLLRARRGVLYSWASERAPPAEDIVDMTR